MTEDQSCYQSRTVVVGDEPLHVLHDILLQNLLIKRIFDLVKSVQLNICLHYLDIICTLTENNN